MSAKEEKPIENSAGENTAPAAAVAAPLVPSLPPDDNAKASVAPEPEFETVRVQEYNADKDKWESIVRKIPKGTLVEVISEPSDMYETNPLWLGPEWEEGRGQEFHARWVNIDPKYQTDERQRGYAPVRPEDYKTNRFIKRGKIEGITGTCITCGDLLLMEVSKKQFEGRYARNIERKKRELQEMVGAEVGEAQARLQSEFGEGASVNYRRDESTETLDYADLEADAELEAMMDSGPRNGKTTFGGFQGNPAFNRWNPAGPKPNYGYKG